MTEQRVDDLRIGDILLLKYKGTDPLELFNALYAALKFFDLWWDGKPIDNSAMVRQLHPLFLFLINALDEGGFFHAAIVVQPQYASDEKFVFEIGPGGFNTTSTVDEYLGKLTVDYAVFRYVNNGHTLGDPELPAEPVNQTAVATAHSNTTYSLSTLGLLAVLCVYRKGEPAAARTIMDIAMEWFGIDFAKFISEKRLEEMMREVVLTVLSGMEEPHTMVCTQFVADSFNAADDDGTYALSRQRRSSAKEPRRKRVAATIRLPENDVQEFHKLLSRLSKLKIRDGNASMLKSLPPGVEELYTPSDLAFSINTQPIKR